METETSLPESGKSSWKALLNLYGVTRYHWLVFIGCWLGGIFDGMDSTLMTVVGPKAIAELLGSTDKVQIGAVASWLGAAFLLGWAVGGVLFGLMGDKLGRVRAMVISILLYAVFTGLAGWTHTWQELALCRFLTGLGIGGELVSIATFVAEVWPAPSRALAVGTLITSYQAGVFFAGAANAIMQGWRQTFWLGMLPAVLVVLLRSLMKESDKWLTAKEVAKQDALVKAPFFKSEQRQIGLFSKRNRKGLIIGSLAFGGLLIGYWASLSWIPFWIQDLVGAQSTGNEKSIAVMFQGFGAVLGCIVAGIGATVIGRRPTIMLSSLGCLLTSLYLFLNIPTFSPIVYGWVCLLGFCIGANQAVMYIYLPELFPTLVRASGTGFCLNLGRLITVVSVFLVATVIASIAHFDLARLWFGNPTLSTYGIAAAFFSLSYIVPIFAAWAGDETRHKALPD